MKQASAPFNMNSKTRKKKDRGNQIFIWMGWIGRERKGKDINTPDVQ